MFNSFVNISGQHLNGYVYSTGGGMTGGYHRNTVKRYDDSALISIESAEWHSQDPTIEEYLVDDTVLDELEAVVRQHKMNHWNHKKFTNMFVSDGESESYSFDFDENSISFSSQIYPENYRNKLTELDRIVDKFIKNGEKLPGLVNPSIDDEEHYSLPEGKLEVYVYSYARDILGLRLLNGTDKEINLSESYKIINDDTGVVLVEENIPYGGEVSEHSRNELDIRLKERLNSGNYKIIIGDLEIPFEIR